MLHEHKQKVLDLIEEARNYEGLPNSGLWHHLHEVETHIKQLACPHKHTRLLDWTDHTGNDYDVVECIDCQLVTIKTK